MQKPERGFLRTKGSGITWICSIICMQGTSPGSGNSSERRNNILKNLLLHSGTATSVQKLSDSYYVGKASIVNDLKYVEEWIAPYHLSLVKNKKGTQIAGREKDIREAITAVIHLDEVTLQNLLEIFQPGRNCICGGSFGRPETGYQRHLL